MAAPNANMPALQPRQSMSMDMHMSSTMSTMMPMSTSSSMTDSSMYMTGRMAASQMDMTFFSSTSTPLYSAMWRPASVSAYAGTCIFLIFLSLLLRTLYAGKGVLEARWKSKERAVRRQLFPPTATVAAKTSVNEKDTTTAEQYSDSDSETEPAPPMQQQGTTAAKGKERSASPPFRLSVDLPRALLVTVMVGIGYLLMLAVMTMNVGYFLSVLGGAFVGELFVGRWGAGVVEDHH